MSKRTSCALLLILFVFSFSFAGCAPKKMYYWGDYSKSLYSYRKNASEETLLKHQQTLENIIETSNAENLRVPPGVFAELGYYYFKQNNNTRAIQYFRMEEKTYPESKVLMERLIQVAEDREKDNDLKSKDVQQTETKQ